METFNRIAGVRDATKPLPPPPPPIPQDEHMDSTLAKRASRASLPRDLHRTPSRKSIRSSRHTPQRRSQEFVPPVPQTPGLYSAKEEVPEPELSGRPSQETFDSDADFEWGPSHPCYPHPNPHCAPDSEEFQNTKVIRVKRDWLVAGDLYPQYQNLYPDILDPLVSDTDFRMLLTGINTRLEQIFNPWQMWAWVDALLGVLTGFLWDDFGFTATKRGIRDFERFIDSWNQRVAREGQEIKVIQLRRTGYMSLDFVIPDPGLDTLEPEAGSKEQAA